MMYGFDTYNKDAATSALLVYGLWRSRDMKRFKITPDVWGQVSRAVSGCAFRSSDLWEFIEKMKPKLQVSELKPKWMKTDIPSVMTMIRVNDGFVSRSEGEKRRQFWVDVLDAADHDEVLEVLAKKTSLVIALVRDRLERERPYEAQLVAVDEDEVRVGDAIAEADTV